MDPDGLEANSRELPETVSETGTRHLGMAAMGRDGSLLADLPVHCRISAHDITKFLADTMRRPGGRLGGDADRATAATSWPPDVLAFPSCGMGPGPVISPGACRVGP